MSRAGCERPVPRSLSVRSSWREPSRHPFRARPSCSFSRATSPRLGQDCAGNPIAAGIKVSGVASLAAIDGIGAGMAHRCAVLEVDAALGFRLRLRLGPSPSPRPRARLGFGLGGCLLGCFQRFCSVGCSHLGCRPGCRCDCRRGRGRGTLKPATQPNGFDSGSGVGPHAIRTKVASAADAKAASGRVDGT